MISIGLIVVFALHLLAANVATGAPLVCLWLEVRERRGDKAAGLAGRRLARAALGAIWGAMLLGLTAGGLLWLAGDTAFFEALAVIPRGRLEWGLAELAFYVICMEIYVRRWSRLRPLWHRLLAVLSATNIMYHFPPLFAGIAVARQDPDLLGEVLTYKRLMELFFLNPETLARVAHFLLASFAVTGAALMAVSLRLSRDGVKDGARPAKWGARLALAVTALQLPSGLFLLMQLPPASQQALMGGDLAATGLLGASLLLTLGLLHHLAAVAFGDTQRKVVLRAMAILGLLVLLMVGASHTSQPLPSNAGPTAQIDRLQKTPSFRTESTAP